MALNSDPPSDAAPTLTKADRGLDKALLALSEGIKYGQK